MGQRLMPLDNLTKEWRYFGNLICTHCGLTNERDFPVPN